MGLTNGSRPSCSLCCRASRTLRCPRELHSTGDNTHRAQPATHTRSAAKTIGRSTPPQTPWHPRRCGARRTAFGVGEFRLDHRGHLGCRWRRGDVLMVIREEIMSQRIDNNQVAIQRSPPLGIVAVGFVLLFVASIAANIIMTAGSPYPNPHLPVE